MVPRKEGVDGNTGRVFPKKAPGDKIKGYKLVQMEKGASDVPVDEVVDCPA